MSDVLLNFVGGTWRQAASGRTFENENPSHRGSVLNLAQDSDESDMDEAIAAAAKAFGTWRATPPNDRAALVAEFLRLLAEAKEELARIVSMENGKTLREARGEVESALIEGRYHNRQIAVFGGASAPRGGGSIASWEQFHPLGVVGVISPWNYPINVMCRKTLPALLTGNTVVFKPASFTPWSATFMAGLFERSAFLPGVFNCVTGRGSRIGNRLVADPRVRAISFTGSTEVGKKIQSMAAVHLTRTQLELGGKNALIVLDDADVDAAVEAAVCAGFGCSGQWCTSTSRVLLQKGVSPAFLDRLRARCERMTVGDALDEATDMGPVAGPAQFRNVASAIQRGLDEGAHLETGGVPATAEGYFIRPTVFTGVRADMALFREEIFGPVLAVSEVADLEEALRMANDSVYGLSSALFTRDLAAASRYIEAMDAGMAHVNIHTGFKTPELPFGGWKESGYGLPENGRTGLEFFVDRKAVYVKA